jgi:sulfite reductase (NADPH) flavoprotein alpha-component
LNSFKFHEGIKHIWIFAATYGNGEAPENGSDFEKAFLTIPEKAKITYSVVGFGSKFYPKFCQFAKDIDSRLQLQTWAIKKTDLHLINQRSKSEYIIFLKDCYRSIKLDFPKIIDWPSWD